MSDNLEFDFSSLASEETSVEETTVTVDEAVVEVAEPVVEVESVEAVETETEEPTNAVDADGDVEPLSDDPREAEREALRERSKYSDWYVIHSYAGYENRVKTNLESRIKTLNMEDYIFEVAVPIEDVVEIKAGVRKIVKRNKFPGYVLVRMDLSNDDVWGVVRHTPGVTGFVGHGHSPSALDIEEVVDILVPKGAVPVVTGGKAAPKPKVEVLDFNLGDSVLITEGPFATLQATIAEINTDTQKVFVLVEIFGRETRVELSFNQIRANS